MSRVRVLVSGRVQGVSFRWYTAEAAGLRGVAGWVRNLPGGGVEAVFEGDPGRVRAMVDWCRSGPSGARVTSVDVIEEPPEGLPGFDIRT